MGASGQFHAPVGLPPAEAPPVSIEQAAVGGGGTRAGLDAVVKKKITSLAGNRTPTVQLVT
jgi:hypothetical protein